MTKKVPRTAIRVPSKSWSYFHRGKGRPEATIAWKAFDCAIQDQSGKTYFEMKGVEAPESWSQTAVEIAASKYFRRAGLRNKSGSETSVRQMITRVAETLADFGLSRKYFKNPDEADAFSNELKVLLYQQKGSFNSPVWFNLGLFHKYKIESDGLRYAFDFKSKKIVELDHVFARPQVSACFIQALGDDLESIFDLVKTEARIFKYGSGSGTNFSGLRSRFETLSGGGRSSGVLAFLEVFDRAAGSIKSGGTTRRAAKMVILDIDHPEVEDFIEWKVREEKKAKALIEAGFNPHFDGEAYRTVSGQNGNNSIRVTDDFMKCVEAGGLWRLRNRKTKEVLREVPASELWKKMAQSAWECADPGVQFHDTINRWHTCSQIAPIRASNPCSEYMFLDDSACNLASLNLLRFLTSENKFDRDGFVAAARRLFFAQEMLVDLASYPTEMIARNSHEFRPLGLGIAGLGSFLMQKGIPYESREGRNWASGIAALLTGVAYEMSGELAQKFSPFKGWKKNKNAMKAVMKKHAQALGRIEDHPELPLSALQEVWARVAQFANTTGFRNAQATVIAPTGTIGLVMDSETTGIEPEYALVRRKNLAGGGSLTLTSRSLSQGLINLGYSQAEVQRILGYASRQGSVRGCQFLKQEHQEIFATALEISPEGHLLMMAAVQPFVSGAISKTVNLPEQATVETVEKLYLQAWKLGLKSISIYRDQSKSAQPLQALHQPPTCPECGSTTELSGSCFRCTNCGSVVGCG